MNLLISRRCLLTLVVTLCIGPVAKSQTRNLEQSFHEDESLPNSVALTPEVLNAVLHTEEGEQGLQDAKRMGQQDIPKLFKATQVDLGIPGKTGYLVVGSFPFSGGDSTWFWVVYPKPIGSMKALFVGGNSVEIRRSRSKGYRDIASYWSNPNGTSTRIFRFNGNSYTLFRSTWTGFDSASNKHH